MTDTASPDWAAVLGQAAKALRLLGQEGVTAEMLQRVIDDPQYRARVARALKGTISSLDGLNTFVPEVKDRHFPLPAREKSLLFYDYDQTPREKGHPSYVGPTRRTRLDRALSQDDLGSEYGYQD